MADEIALIEQVASNAVIDAAYAWLCWQRRNYHHNDDVWHVRHGWAKSKPRVQAQLVSGTYRFQEQRLIRGAERTVDLWSALDALVLKALAIVLGDVLRPHLSVQVFHLGGLGR